MAGEPRDPPRLDVVPNAERDEIIAAFSQSSRFWAIMAEHADQLARTRKKLFDAYIKAGFARSEALELVKTLGI
jgi:hypothetical protein